MTDGDWLWRQSLAFFVERRNVALPGDFLSLIRGRAYAVPDRSREELLAYTRVAHEQVF